MWQFADRFIEACVAVDAATLGDMYGVASLDRYNAGPPRFPGNAMRFDLKVPFAEKDQAKRLGARWDAGRKRWYIDGHLDAALFSQWQPTPPGESSGESPAQKRKVPGQESPAEKVHVGRRFVELPRVCDCLPWDDCDRCRLQSWPE